MFYNIIIITNYRLKSNRQIINTLLYYNNNNMYSVKNAPQITEFL